MKAAVLTALRQMEIRDVPDPTIEKDNDVLLKIEMVGVCGSDVHYYETGRIGRQIVEYPFIIGHECSATVEAIGSSVTGVKVGDQVTVDPAVPCHQCYQCRIDRENTCEDMRFLGCPGQGGGCLCEYIVMPEESCFPTKGAITLEQAALCEPLSIAVYAVKRAQIPEGAGIGILGAGPIGLSVLLSAKAEKARKIYVTEKIDARLEAARGVGVTWAGNPDSTDVVSEILAAEPLGLDVIIECCGQQEALDQAFEILKPGGLLVIIGTARKDRISFDVDTFKRKEISIRYVRRQNHCVQTSLDLIGSGQVNVDFMITHHFRLEETKKAFDLVAGYHDGVIKAMIKV
ncbi:MAG: alcohol dehydrogenase catalytic domain-containing protein [Planctomycetes bacterium]|nr:alcohol dehydrogenase catalytic domain-containing protein [Planctomycetota bacterium]